MARLQVLVQTVLEGQDLLHVDVVEEALVGGVDRSGHQADGQRRILRLLQQLDRGARVTELLKQPQYSPLPISLMAATLFAVNKGYLDDIDVKKVLSFEHGLHQHLKSSHAALLAKLENDKAMDKGAEEELTAAITAFKKSFA